ncbi:MAG: hypothetical protein PHU18_01160 [Dehalococcoidales bacterium]|nr:hypothetical protein [Dehalococcoidales bacterium]
MPNKKAIRKLLLLDKDGRSLGHLFKALFQQALDADPVLSFAGVTLECAGIGHPDILVEGKKVKREVQNALIKLGLPCSDELSKDIVFYPELVATADIIIVPTLAQEDGICLKYDNAWSKVVTLSSDSQTLAGINSIKLPEPATKLDYIAWAEWVKPVLNAITRMLKQSFAESVVVRGISKNKGIAVGEAHVARHGNDLIGFRRGNILVIDRAGTLMFNDLEAATTKELINDVAPNIEISSPKAFAESFDFTSNEKPSIKKTAPANGLGVIKTILSRASAVVCSCDDKYMQSAKFNDIPVLAYCVGATDRISQGQHIIVDADNGMVYDVSLLKHIT